MDATDQSINKSDLSENNKTRGSLEPVIAHLVLKFTLTHILDFSVRLFVASLFRLGIL
jgi:hypothetical protein